MGTIANNDNLYGPYKWIVDPVSGRGTQTTIAAAITAASAGDVIFIRPGTYTENLTTSKTLRFVGSEQSQSSTIILGKISDSGAVSVHFQNLTLKTNGDYAISLASASSVFTIKNCYLRAQDFTFANIAASATLDIYSCLGDTSTTGIGLWTGAGAFLCKYCIFSNSGATTTLSSGSGTTNLYYSIFTQPVGCSSGGFIQASYTRIITVDQNVTCLTTSGTGTTELDHCEFISGTATAVSAGSGTTIEMYECTVDSSNTNAVSGAGTLVFSSVTFAGTSSVMNTTTQTPAYTNLGKWKASGQPCVSARLVTTISNNTGDGTIATVIFDTAETNIGSSYNTGTGVFTAPVTGNYLITAHMAQSNSAGGLNCGVRLVTTTRTYFGTALDSASLGPNNWYYTSVSSIVPLAASDTAEIKIQCAGGTKTSSSQGSASNANCFLSIILIS